MREQEGRIGSIELIKEMLGIIDCKIVTAKIVQREKNETQNKVW